MLIVLHLHLLELLTILEVLVVPIFVLPAVFGGGLVLHDDRRGDFVVYLVDFLFGHGRGLFGLGLRLRLEEQGLLFSLLRSRLGPSLLQLLLSPRFFAFTTTTLSFFVLLLELGIPDLDQLKLAVNTLDLSIKHSDLS